MNFGFVFLLPLGLGDQVDFDVGIGHAAHIHGGQFRGLDHLHHQRLRVEIVLQFVLQFPQIFDLFFVLRNKYKASVNEGDRQIGFEVNDVALLFAPLLRFPREHLRRPGRLFRRRVFYRHLKRLIKIC